MSLKIRVKVYTAIEKNIILALRSGNSIFLEHGTEIQVDDRLFIIQKDGHYKLTPTDLIEVEDR